MLEAGDRPGGLSTTVDVGGAPVERYYHHLMPSDRHALELARDLGVHIEWFPSSVAYCDGETTYPCAGITDILRLPTLSVRGRVRYLLGALAVALAKAALASLDAMPLLDWTTRTFGWEAAERFWAPLLESRWGAAAEQLSAAWLWQRLKKRMSCRAWPLSAERLGYPVGSFQAVIDALAQGIAQAGGQIRCREHVRGFQRDATGFSLATTHESMRCDAVVLALPFPAISRLDAPPIAPMIDEVGTVPHVGTVELMLVSDGPPTDAYWTNVADPAAPMCGIVEHTHLVPAERYAGKHITYLVCYAAQDDPLWEQSDAEVESTFLECLWRLAPRANAAHIEQAFVFRDHSTHAVRRCGFGARVESWRRPREGVYVVNDALAYPDDRGLDVCAMLGQQCADELIGQLQA